jgi:dsDNA-specific endonuclease/ATPase MutS2
VSIDEPELDKIIKTQNAGIHTRIAEEIKNHSDQLKKIPEKLEELSNLLMLFDFSSGVSNIKGSFPVLSDRMAMSNSRNIFLNNAQEISFHLDNERKCSILTGANSGGKTTLLEHIIQLVCFFQLGLPVSGKLEMPLFSDVYYFAKTKGSASKGAFETLLSQMNDIEPGKKTLILADEIEAVTEPGVAGKIISATAEFFINKGCFLVIATHLGHEIQKKMPMNARLDGIEAKGLDEFFELIVDHNPVLGKLASSTPELIIQKMAQKNTDYFTFLNRKVREEN